MFSQNNYQQVFVGGNASASTGTAAGKHPENMNAEEIGIFTPGGSRYVESSAGANEVVAAAGSEFVVGFKGIDGTVLRSDKIKLADVKRVTRKVGSAAAEQVDYVGYNGTTGSIEALNDNFYRVRINLQEGFTDNSHGTEYLKHAIYESDASATQAEIAIGLAGSGVYNFLHEPKNSSGNPYVKFKAVTNVALASDFVFDATFEISGVKGSTMLVSAAASPTYNTGTALAVGDFLRIGTAAGATGGAVALLSDVYRVKSLPSTTIIELDRPLQTATGQYTIANGAITVIPAATGVAANWGMIMTAQPQDFSANPTQGVKLPYTKVKFKTTLENFGTTVQGTTTASNPGIGTYEQVAELEIFARGNNGEFYRTGSPVQFSWSLNADAALDPYDLIHIEYETNVTGLTGTAKHPKVLTLCIPQSTPAYADSGTADDITDVLEVLLTGAVDGNGGVIGSGDLAI